MMLTLSGGRVLCPDGTLQETDVTLDGGVISAVGSADTTPETRWDVSGHMVLPAIVDLHGDAFERQIMPRPGVHFPMKLALSESDQQMVANGIATAYHGITYSWEPGLRGRKTVLSLLEAIEAARDHLSCDTRVHLRYEIFNVDGMNEVADWIKSGMIDLLAFNDHMPMVLNNLAHPTKAAKYAARTGLSAGEFADLVDQTLAHKSVVGQNVERLALLAKSHGIVCASHDDETPDMRVRYHDLGVRISEFPVDDVTAQLARDKDDVIVMGAPNVLRGGSHCQRMCATDAVRMGLCDVLTSDYYYPAQLQAAFKLAEQGVTDLSTAWGLVSRNPAKAAGLSDRGDIAPGKRADLVVVDVSIAGLPKVVATFVGGRAVYTRDVGQRKCA